MDLLERIDGWAAATPDRIAHVSGDQTLTYGKLRLGTDRVAAQLGRLLPADHSPIVVLGHKEPEILIAFLGAIKAGHPYVPLDSSTPDYRVERIANIAGASMILTPAQVAAWVGVGAVPIPLPARHLAPDDPFYIIFTSGSTGEPKGVVITSDCLASFLNWMLAEQQFAEAQEVFLNQAPFSFDLSVMDLYLSLATGSTLFSINHDDIANPAQLYRTLGRSTVTTWVSTPSFAQMCLAEPTFAEGMLPHLRRFLFCGETLAPEVAAVLLDRFPTAAVWNTYGPTETTVATTSICVDRQLLAQYRPLPVGYPKPDSHILVVDDQGQPLVDGERGEIVIAGPNVSPGYLGRPDLTAKAFFDLQGRRTYRTGDFGRFRDGMLFCDGRRDGQIKLHGYRIELGDVEAHLQAVPGVRDGVIVPKLTDGRPDWLAAFVILAEPPDGSLFEIGQSLRRQLGARLPVYMLPRKFFFLTTFPITANGKADRKKLAEMIA